MNYLPVNSLYRRALRGLPGLGTPHALAEDLASSLSGDPTGSADAHHKDQLIRTLGPVELSRRHLVAAASTGFVCGLPGFASLPLSLPANLAALAAIQLHLASTIAFLSGVDAGSASKRPLVIGCLNQEGVFYRQTEGLERAGLKVLERGIRTSLRRLGRGSRAARRVTPLLGGAIGAVSDASSTLRVARTALETFGRPLQIDGSG